MEKKIKDFINEELTNIKATFNKPSLSYPPEGHTEIQYKIKRF